MRSLPTSPTLSPTAPGPPARKARASGGHPALGVLLLAQCPGWTGSPCSWGWPWHA
jgi:hypothetical protein